MVKQYISLFGVINLANWNFTFASCFDINDIYTHFNVANLEALCLLRLSFSLYSHYFSPMYHTKYKLT